MANNNTTHNYVFAYKDDEGRPTFYGKSIQNGVALCTPFDGYSAAEVARTFPDAKLYHLVAVVPRRTKKRRRRGTH